MIHVHLVKMDFTKLLLGKHLAYLVQQAISVQRKTCSQLLVPQELPVQKVILQHAILVLTDFTKLKLGKHLVYLAQLAISVQKKTSSQLLAP